MSCDFYKKDELFIDFRFTKHLRQAENNKFSLSLNSNEIIDRLTSLIGTKYIWGGNFSNGIEDINKYYPATKEIIDAKKDKRILKGVDCSGFLYEITNGFTPRNTSDLMKYKNSLPIKDLGIEQIINIVKPLDIIVYTGHVIIILDNNTTIESCKKFGVVKKNLFLVLNKLFKVKTPADEYTSSNHLVIRRWFGID